MDDHSSATAVAGGVKLPTRALRAEITLRRVSLRTLSAEGPYSALLRVGLAMPALLPGLRWALTPPFHPRPDMQGSLFSVALSLGLPPPGVTRHPCFMESGLSSGSPAVIQPSARGGT